MINGSERIIYKPSKQGNGMAIPLSLGPTLKYYSIICQEKDLKQFFVPIVREYVQEFKSPSNCELCERSHFALTAHHLVPRSVRDIALKHGWHKKETLSRIAWLCRGCHDYVHRIASPTTLGKEYWSIELLLRRTEIWLFAKMVGRLGWGDGGCAENQLQDHDGATWSRQRCPSGLCNLNASSNPSCVALTD